MAESAVSPSSLTDEPQRRLQLRRVLELIVHPRATLEKMSAVERGVWFTPMVLWIVLLVVRVLVSAPIRQAQAESGAITLPNFQFYTPEQQAQLQQGLQATQGPVFQYVFPIGGAIVGALILWSVTAGLLYLISTLRGGRTTMTRSLNLVAWATTPTLIHLTLQILYVLSSGKLIQESGLALLTPPPPQGSLLLHALLSRVDLYLFWHIVLLLIGLKCFSGMSSGKVWSTVLFTIALVMLLRLIPDFLAAQLGDLTIIRPFLF